MRKITGEDFPMVYRLMEESFPLDEYRTYSEQEALLYDPAYGIYILQGSDGASVKAFLAVWEFDTFLYIEHFAVDPACRNGGVGGGFLREFLRGAGKIVCLEVEPPDSEITSRRIGFYERNHFFLNAYPYMQPAITKGRNPIPLLIMTYGRPVGKKEFDEMKEVLYSRVYKQGKDIVL